MERCAGCPNNSDNKIEKTVVLKKLRVSSDFPLSSCETCVLLQEFLEGVASLDLPKLVSTR